MLQGHPGSVVIALRTIPLNEVDDHAREQVNGLAVLCRRDLDDLGLSQRQPERR